MNVITEIIMVIAIAMAMILMVYYIMWTIRRRIKGRHVVNNLEKLSWMPQLIMIVALLVNWVYLGTNYNPITIFCALIAIVATVVISLSCRQTLLINFANGIIPGKKCDFQVASVSEAEVSGYVVVDGNWLYAKAKPTAEKNSSSLEELQWITAVICASSLDEREIDVEI